MSKSDVKIAFQILMLFSYCTMSPLKYGVSRTRSRGLGISRTRILGSLVSCNFISLKVMNFGIFSIRIVRSFFNLNDMF